METETETVDDMQVIMINFVSEYGGESTTFFIPNDEYDIPQNVWKTLSTRELPIKIRLYLYDEFGLDGEDEDMKDTCRWLMYIYEHKLDYLLYIFYNFNSKVNFSLKLIAVHIIGVYA
jgi:hypothetical protein